MPAGFGKLFCATIVSPAGIMAAAVAISATGASNTIRERKRVICSSSGSLPRRSA
jgi:hypothetical protein